MTAIGATSAPRRATSSQLGLALAIAFRELRSGAGGLTVFVLCIALGVAAVAAIGSLAASFDDALARQGRTLIGGDLSFELVHRQANTEEHAALEALGRLSESASFRAMARSEGGKSALIEVKAVDDDYPLYGDVAITRAEKPGPIWRDDGVVLVERTLLDRLGVDVGSKLRIGEATTTIGGVLGEQPDRLADRLAYGPKVLMSRGTLAKTGLVQPGSLIRWIYRLKLPEPAASDKQALAETRKDIEARFPESGFAIHDWTDPAPSLRRDADRFTQFINFVGLTALLLGGIGVGNAIRKLHGQEARDHCHLQVSRRLEPPRARHLHDPGAVPRFARHRARPRHRRAGTRRDRHDLRGCAPDHARDRAPSSAASDRCVRRPPDHGAVRPLASRTRCSRVARRSDARASDRRARALVTPLRAWIGGGGYCAVRSRHRRLRGASHHRLDLGRDRRRLPSAHRLRPSRAAPCRQRQARARAVSRSRAVEHRRTGLACPLDRRLARAWAWAS